MSEPCPWCPDDGYDCFTCGRAGTDDNENEENETMTDQTIEAPTAGVYLPLCVGVDVSGDQPVVTGAGVDFEGAPWMYTSSEPNVFGPDEQWHRGFADNYADGEEDVTEEDVLAQAADEAAQAWLARVIANAVALAEPMPEATTEDRYYLVRLPMSGPRNNPTADFLRSVGATDVSGLVKPFEHDAPIGGGDYVQAWGEVLDRIIAKRPVDEAAGHAHGPEFMGEPYECGTCGESIDDAGNVERGEDEEGE